MHLHLHHQSTMNCNCVTHIFQNPIMPTVKSMLLPMTFKVTESGTAFISDLHTSLFVQYLLCDDLLSLLQAHRPESRLPSGLPSRILSGNPMADYSDFTLNHPLAQQGLP